jgi:urease accessory protein UreF
VAGQISDVNNLRQRLAVALRQAQYEGRWPLVVSSYRFNQPRDVQAAMDKADQYLQHAAQNQAEILRENAQLDQTQRRAERIIQSMTQIREQMTYTPATTSLQNDDRQLQTFNLDLQNTLAQLQNINARKVDLRPFSLFN